MKNFLLLLEAEIRRDYIFIRRYPLEIISSICFIYFVFLLTFFSAKFVYGDKEIRFLGSSIEGWVISYVMWIFASAATSYMSEQLKNEALIGILEQLYLSPFGLIYILLARACLIFLYISFSLPIFLYLLQVSTGVYLKLNLCLILPTLVLTFMGMCGFGFILAGITLVFKRIGPLLLIIPFFPLGLAMFPIEDLSHNLQIFALILPLIQGVKLIRLVVLESQNFVILFRNGEILILALNSFLYLAIGIFIYKTLERIAKDRGLLGHY
ncbi:MAG: ABC transporter permease [bacterium]